MGITLEAADQVIESLCCLISSDEKLNDEIRKAGTWQERRQILEKIIKPHLSSFSDQQCQDLLIKKRIFYQLQKKTQIDYGFCKYLVPAFRNRAEYKLY